MANVWPYVYFAIKSIGLGGVDYFCLGRSKQNYVYHFFQIRYARSYLIGVPIYVELNEYQKIFLPGDIDKDVLMQRL